MKSVGTGATTGQVGAVPARAAAGKVASGVVRAHPVRPEVVVSKAEANDVAGPPVADQGRNGGVSDGAVPAGVSAGTIAVVRNDRPRHR